MIAALQLDFAPRARATPGRAGRVTGFVLLLLAALLAAGATQQNEQQQLRIDELQSRLDRQLRIHQGRVDTATTDEPGRVAPDAASRGRSGAGDTDLQRRLLQANLVIDELTVPWALLFSAIEAVPTQGVVLQELLPDARAGQLRLRATAPNLEAALAYVGRLSRQPALSQVHLLNYAIAEAESAAPIGFTVQSTWQPR